MFLYLFTINVLVYQVKMILLYSVQTTNLSMVSKNEMYVRQLYHCVIPNSESHIISYVVYRVEVLGPLQLVTMSSGDYITQIVSVLFEKRTTHMIT